MSWDTVSSIVGRLVDDWWTIGGRLVDNWCTGVVDGFEMYGLIATVNLHAMSTQSLISRPLYISSSGSSCGYCNGQKQTHGLPGLPGVPSEVQQSSEVQQLWEPEEPSGSAPHITLGCQLDQVSCADYDRFINLGFRRSGLFLYKGDMLRGCCRMYTIRTTLGMLPLSKEHRQTVNRFKRAIADDPAPKPSLPLQNAADAGTAHKHTTKAAKNTFSLQSLIEAENASSRFHTRFEPTEFSDEKYALYKKYQMAVHNDGPEEVSEMQFMRFLCESPFDDDEIEGTDAEWATLNAWVSQAAAGGAGSGQKQTRRLGPVHECYYLDEKLIAISVLDFLPSGISSVYFIWDPDYAHLSLGTLSALREIQMCDVLGLGYYYLGYYIGDCAKMRYKGKYGGELLDVCAERYFPLDAVQRTQKAAASAAACVPAPAAASPQPFQTYDRFWSFEAGTPGVERELTLSGRPAGSDAESGEDTSAAVYGSDETYKAADAAKRTIFADHDVGKLQLPPVVPGCMPMQQVLKWLQSEESAHMQVSLFTTADGQFRTAAFAEMSRQLRAIVLDFMRLFGVAKTQQGVIVI